MCFRCKPRKKRWASSKAACRTWKAVAGALVLRLTQVWADADLDELARYASWCDCLNTETDRAQQARLLDERNPPLADAIAALHNAGKRVFAAVGSLHMIGPLSLPALLAQRGFSVERVRFSP